MSFSRRSLLAAGLASLLAAPAFALAADQAQGFVRGVVDKLTALVSRKAGPDAFIALVQDAADLDAIGRFTAGLGWRQMNDAQKARYAEAFRNYAARVYTARLTDYDGQTVTVTGAKDLGRRGVLVQSRFNHAGGKPLDVDWLVSDRSGATRLVDVIGAGVSVSTTLRSQFAAMQARRNGDMDAFIDDLKSLKP